MSLKKTNGVRFKKRKENITQGNLSQMTENLTWILSSGQLFWPTLLESDVFKFH